METAILLFKQYSGQGMIMTLFLLSLGYLWFVEKSREKQRNQENNSENTIINRFANRGAENYYTR